MARVTWRMRFAPYIHETLAANETEKGRRRALRELWRELFGDHRIRPRGRYSYRVFRHEARVQMGLIPRSRKRPAHRSALQLVLPHVTGDD